MAGTFTAKNVALPPVSTHIEDVVVQTQFQKLNQAIQSLFGQYVAELTSLIPTVNSATAAAAFTVPSGSVWSFVIAQSSLTASAIVNLQSGPSVNSVVVVKKGDVYEHPVIINPAAQATIDGRTTWRLTTPLAWVILVYSATNTWSVI